LPTKAEKPFFDAPPSPPLETEFLAVSVLDDFSLLPGAEPSPAMLPKKLRFFSGGGNGGVGVSPRGVLGPCAMMLSWL